MPPRTVRSMPWVVVLSSLTWTCVSPDFRRECQADGDCRDGLVCLFENCVQPRDLDAGNDTSDTNRDADTDGRTDAAGDARDTDVECVAVAELCNGADDDCDGLTDEHAQLGEVCNGNDDDCDGQTDETCCAVSEAIFYPFTDRAWDQASISALTVAGADEAVGFAVITDETDLRSGLMSRGGAVETERTFGALTSPSVGLACAMSSCTTLHTVPGEAELIVDDIGEASTSMLAAEVAASQPGGLVPAAVGAEGQLFAAVPLDSGMLFVDISEGSIGRQLAFDTQSIPVAMAVAGDRVVTLAVTGADEQDGQLVLLALPATGPWEEVSRRSILTSVGNIQSAGLTARATGELVSHFVRQSGQEYLLERAVISISTLDTVSSTTLTSSSARIVVVAAAPLRDGAVAVVWIEDERAGVHGIVDTPGRESQEPVTWFREWTRRDGLLPVAAAHPEGMVLLLAGRPTEGGEATVVGQITNRELGPSCP